MLRTESELVQALILKDSFQDDPAIQNGQSKHVKNILEGGLTEALDILKNHEEVINEYRPNEFKIAPRHMLRLNAIVHILKSRVLRRIEMKKPYTDKNAFQEHK